jgi:MFS family permease
MFPMPNANPLAVDAAAHVVQLALTPIFLLTGIASLLNVFSTRLGRIADQVEKLVESENESLRRLGRLRLRSTFLDIAVLLAAIAGALTCAAAMTLFVGEIKTGGAGRLLFALFGGALVCAITALAAFSFEMILAGQGTRKHAEGEE